MSRLTIGVIASSNQFEPQGMPGNISPEPLDSSPTRIRCANQTMPVGIGVALISSLGLLLAAKIIIGDTESRLLIDALGEDAADLGIQMR
jgi:hypothetical protein